MDIINIRRKAKFKTFSAIFTLFGIGVFTYLFFIIASDGFTNSAFYIVLFLILLFIYIFIDVTRKRTEYFIVSLEQQIITFQYSLRLPNRYESRDQVAQFIVNDINGYQLYSYLGDKPAILVLLLTQPNGNIYEGRPINIEFLKMEEIEVLQQLLDSITAKSKRLG